MRRTVRALSVAALAGALPVIAAAAAFAEPAAEISPSNVSPGRSITVSVSCDPLGGPAPASTDASSGAFEEGTVQLRRVAGNEEGVSGPAYTGTARIAPAADPKSADGVGPDTATVDGTCPAAPGGRGKQWSATFTVSRGGANGPCADPLDTTCDGGKPCPDPRDSSCDTGEPCPDPRDSSCETGEPCPDPRDSSCETGEPCPDPRDSSCETGEPCPDPRDSSCDGGKPCPDPRDSSCDTGRPCAEPHDTSCGGAVIQHGVRAGEGGTFTDSVPAQVAGGLLIAGACGGAVYRLRRKGPATDG